MIWEIYRLRCGDDTKTGLSSTIHKGVE